MENPMGAVGAKKSKWKLTYNAGFTLTFCFLSLAILLLNALMGGVVNGLFGLSSDLGVDEFYRLITYVLCHADLQHFIGNIMLLLMLGPILEEKYGAKLLALMTIFTAVVTGLLNVLLFEQGIIGASGIVFMFIVLSSMVNMKEKEVPLTFVFIVLIYVGGEVLNSFGADNISQFAHIIGGVIGGGLGFLLSRKKLNF